MKSWYKKELIRNLVDMHIPNGEGYLEKFDPKKYAENVKKSGATVAYIYASNCLGLCFYPTETGLRHKEAERDIFGETVKECRKLGLGVVGYLNSWGSFVSDAHPEWDIRYSDGSARRDKYRFGTPCVNNDAYIEYFLSLVRELVSNYELDGLWIDQVGIYAPVCFCEDCQRKYGKPLPTTVNIDDPAFLDYLHFKGKAVASYVRRIRETALRINPNLSISMNCGIIRGVLAYGASLDYFETLDYLAGDFYEKRDGVNAVSRILYKLTPNLPFEYMTSRCVSLERHTMNKDINELILHSYAAMMYKGAFVFIDAIDPSGEMDGKVYEELSVIKENIETYRPYINFEEKAVREVAVYFNFHSGLPAEQNGLPIDEMKAKYVVEDLKKIAVTMASANLDYDIISPKNLAELSNYKVLILSNMEMLGEDEVKAIREYVANGGNVYISGVTSIRDDAGHLYDNFMMSDIMGVEYAGRFDIKPNYLAPEEEYQHLFGKYTKKYPHMLEEAFVKVVASGTGKAMAKVTLPISDSSNHLLFSTAISDPPINYTDYPALYENTYGNGKVIYSAGLIEKDSFAANQQLFTTLVKYLVGEQRVVVSAPNCVDHTVYESEQYLKVNLLNHQDIHPPIRIDDIKVEIKIEDKKIKTVSDISGGKMHWSVKDGVLQIITDLNVYKLIVVELM